MFKLDKSLNKVNIYVIQKYDDKMKKQDWRDFGSFKICEIGYC